MNLIIPNRIPSFIPIRRDRLKCLAILNNDFAVQLIHLTFSFNLGFRIRVSFHKLCSKTLLEVTSNNGGF